MGTVRHLANGALAIAAYLAACGTPAPLPAETVDDPLPATRLLRRVSLVLTGHTPTAADYQALTALPTEAERLAAVDAKVDTLLQSPDFYRTMVEFGHDWLRTSEFIVGGSSEGLWRGDSRGWLRTCPDNATHAGKLYGIYYNTDSQAVCNDGAAVVNQVEPWWAPGTTVAVVGNAGTGVRQDPALADPECRHMAYGIYEVQLQNSNCSCGPNLVYCVNPAAATETDSNSEHAAARQVFEEPARLFAHMAWHDRPLTDLVLGNYSVGPARLQAVYVGIGSYDRAHAYLDDDDSWWNPAKFSGLADPLHATNDPLAWREFIVESRLPMLLSVAGNSLSGDMARTYKFDPRSDAGAPLGIPAAGVLTTLGSFSSFARERVRAARWLETFACINFVPPAPSAQFNEYLRDPATEGSCQHCHTSIDPAAIHFKRWTTLYGNYNAIAGVGPWQQFQSDRFDQAFVPDTKLTPVDLATAMSKPDSRLIDFLPADQTLLGQTSDGTIGPLGFGKMLVQSGEFDRCVTATIYRRIIGHALDPATEATYLDALTQEFVAQGRTMRGFIKTLLQAPEFRRGV